jgi:hypothetical protein
MRARPLSSLTNARTESTKLKPIVRDIVGMIASSADPTPLLTLRSATWAMKKKLALEDQIRRSELFTQVRTILANGNRNHDTGQATRQLLDLANANPWFVPMLWEVVDVTTKDRVPPHGVGRPYTGVRRQLDRNDPDLGALYCDLSWMTEEQLRYRAVAVLYNLSKKQLDAMIAATEELPQRPKAPHEPNEVIVSQQWDDVIKRLDLDDMVVVTKCLVPESQVDDILVKFRRELRISMH